MEPKQTFTPQDMDRIEASDKYLAEHSGENLVSGSASIFTRINFDGTTERNGIISSEEIKNRIASCREAYENVGIIGNIIDIMVDFALEDFTIVHPSKTIQNFYINWARDIGLVMLAEQILKSIYRDSNVPILTFRGQMPQDKINELKRVIAAKSNKQMTNTPTSDLMPLGYKILDILRLEKYGSELLGTTSFRYVIPSEEIDWLKNPSTPIQQQQATKLSNALGPEAFELLKKGLWYLEPDRINMLYYKKDSYRRWANPMLWRVMSDVKFKKLLRDMDISVAESVCNTLTVVKLGKVEEKLVPSPEKYTAFANLLKIPSKSKTIVWDNLIDIQAVYPPVDKILGEEKYRQVNNDILSGCGIPEILVNGTGGGNYSAGYLSVRTLLERLETGRTVLLQWINEQMQQVADAMGFRKPAWVKMRFMSLQDEEVEKRMMLELADRNMLSYRTLIERFGENFDIEVERMKEEDALRKQVEKDSPFTLLKTGKFGPLHNDGPLTILDFIGQDGQTTPTPPGAKQPQKQAPTGQEGQGPKGGRPAGTKKKQQVTRKTKPQGQKTISEDTTPKFEGFTVVKTIDPNDFASISGRLETIVQMLESAVIENNNGAQPSVEQLNQIFEGAIRAMAALYKSSEVSKTTVGKVMCDELATAPAKLERCVESVRTRKVADFKKKKGRAPDKKEMQDIISSAYAICTAALRRSGAI